MGQWEGFWLNIIAYFLLALPAGLVVHDFSLIQMSSKTLKPLPGVGEADEEDGSSTVTMFSQDTHETIDTLVSTEYTAAEDESMCIFFLTNTIHRRNLTKRFTIF